MEVCNGALIDEIKALKLTISTLRIYSYQLFSFPIHEFGLNCFITTIPLWNVVNIPANVLTSK